LPVNPAFLHTVKQQQAEMPEKSCLQHLQTLYPYQPTGFLNITIEGIGVYVIFNLIMLSLQILYGVTACRTGKKMDGQKSCPSILETYLFLLTSS